MILAGSELPFHKTFLSSPAIGEGVSDSHSEVGVEEKLRIECNKASPKRTPVFFDKSRLSNSLHEGGKIDFVSFGLLVHLAQPCSNIVHRKTDQRCDKSSTSKSSRIHKAVLSESSIETFFEVVIRTSQRNVEDEVPHNVHVQSLPHLSRGSKLPDSLKRTIGVVSSPIRVDLNIELLADRHQSEGVRHDGTSNTSHCSNDSFFTIAEIVVGLVGLDCVVDGSVESVSDQQVAESRIKEGVEAGEEHG